MARLGYLENNWPLVHLMTEKALAITEKTGSYLLETDSWGYELYDLAAICCYRLGMYEKAHNYALIAIKMEPDDIRLKRNLELIDIKYNAALESSHE
ncbi:hypothetical protein [Anaerocolumna sedimenticola]|uniref:hypothetical protein n=1 Tax=Anaerocolumna sedimenticola TaxID=2696063 RepID=UPI002ED56C09